MIETTTYVRKPLFVEAVKVTKENFEEIAKWCQGNIYGNSEQFIKIRVFNPKIHKSQAFVGDWILYTDRGYMVYNEKTFLNQFNIWKLPEGSINKLTVEDNNIMGKCF